MKFEVVYHFNSDLHPGEISGLFTRLFESAPRSRSRLRSR
jgi:hypothetical protein